MFARNTETQTRAKCVRRSCPWHIYATRDNASNVYQIKTLVNEHSYPFTNKNRRVTAKWLSLNYLHKFKCISAMTLNDIKDLVKADLKINMTITKISRAKLMTIATLEDDLKEEYARLWDYLEQIKRSNPGSTTDMKVFRPTPILNSLYLKDCIFPLIV